MSEHLEIERYLAGDRNAASEQHLNECAACREEAARMETTLAQFSAGVREWARLAPVDGLATRRPAHWTRWLALAAAALLLALMPAYQVLTQRRAAAQAKADSVLLDAIAADISRPAPEPLEPLIELVSTQGENR